METKRKDRKPAATQVFVLACSVVWPTAYRVPPNHLVRLLQTPCEFALICLSRGAER